MDSLLEETTVANIDSLLEVGAGHSALSVMFLVDFAAEMCEVLGQLLPLFSQFTYTSLLGFVFLEISSMSPSGMCSEGVLVEFPDQQHLEVPIDEVLSHPVLLVPVMEVTGNQTSCLFLHGVESSNFLLIQKHH